MLTKVIITPEVWNACWSHALTTETQEIMGLLIGQKDEMNETVLKLSALKISKRITKEKDRVEIEPQDMIEASEYAETLPGSRRVLGWYHSHPHVTVHPSHVDLATQANYQMMDEDFVGLIFSVFNIDSSNTDTKEAIAFQTHNGECNYISIEVSKDDWSKDREKSVLQAVTVLPDILKKEELDECSSASIGGDVLSFVHNQGCLLTQLTSQSSLVTVPMMEALTARKNYLIGRIQLLKEKERTLACNKLKRK